MDTLSPVWQKKAVLQYRFEVLGISQKSPSIREGVKNFFRGLVPYKVDPFPLRKVDMSSKGRVF